MRDGLICRNGRILVRRRYSLQARMQVIDHRNEIKYRQARVAANRCCVGRQVGALQNEGANAGVLLKRAQRGAQDLLLDHGKIDFGIGFGKHAVPFLALFEAQDVQALGTLDADR